MRELKVVVLGSGGVGKSALTLQFVRGTFVERYDPTIEDFYTKDILVDNVLTRLEILDTAGTEQFASMRDLYIRNGMGFIVVYSAITQQTFRDIRTMRDQIVRVKGFSRVPIVLVGNKVDLAKQPNATGSGLQREVSLAEGQALAEQWGCPFIEASARTSENVARIFEEAVREIQTRLPKQGRKKMCTIL